jgi:histone chaperone ASF1
MGYLNVTNIRFLQGNGPVDQPFLLEVRFDCLKDIASDVEWKFVYVASPEGAGEDQVLDRIVMEGLEYGANSFEWEVPAPELRRLAGAEEVLDTTVVMILVLVEGREIFRCSYFVTNEYEDPSIYEEAIDKVIWEKLRRRIDVDHPVITVKEITWETLEKGSRADENKIGIDGNARFQNCDLFKS